MKFKLDENIPIVIKKILIEFGYDDVHSVKSENIVGCDDVSLRNICKEEQRILITLDSDFSNRLQHPKTKIYSIILLKSKIQGKKAIMSLVKSLLDNYSLESIIGKVLIFDGNVIRLQ